MATTASSIGPIDGLGPWQRYICRICGLIYDEADGDSDSGIAAGTRFRDIPDDWECPICHVTKADFDPYVPHSATPPSDATVAISRNTGVVIVGAGVAGWSAVEAIRVLDENIPITVITACSGDVYSKPELSVALTRGSTPTTLKRETGAEAAARLRVRLVSETFAIGLSSSTRTVRTTRGHFRFTDLVIAQGAKSSAPPCLPAELSWRINDLTAWTGLHRTLSGSQKDVVIVGAGFVGCELAEDFSRAGHRVTLIGIDELPLQPMLPKIAAERLKGGLSKLGIRFLGGRTVIAVQGDTLAGFRLAMKSGETIQTDIIVAATGLGTEPRLSRTAGLRFNNGIAVDPATMQTNAPNIYALGDCISIGGTPCRYIEPIRGQAMAIANAILQRDAPTYSHKSPIIRLKSRAVPVVIEGTVSANGDWRVLKNDDDSLVMEQWLHGQLVAKLAAA